LAKGVIHENFEFGQHCNGEPEMKAMILAAGKGTRVRPLTYELPKPMIPVLGKPVMAYLIEHLRRYGVTEIMVNVSHLHTKIEEYFREGEQFGVRIGYSFEGYATEDGDIVSEPLGSAGGIRRIQELGGFFDDTTIVLCGDALIDLDIGAALAEHRRNGAIASVITTEVPWDKVSNYGVVVTDNDGRIIQFQEKPKREEALSNFISTGIYIFEPEVINLIPSGVVFDIGSQLFPLLAANEMPFYAQHSSISWLDIGSVAEYWEVFQLVLKGGVGHMNIPGKEVRPGVRVGLNASIDWLGTKIQGPVYIGSGVTVEAGSTIIGPTWIGHGSHICSGACIERSILFEYTRVLPSATIREMTIFDTYGIDRLGNTRSGINEWLNSKDRRLRPRAPALLHVGSKHEVMA
jgi:mannose-1-phosphate guanylyltransferase